jgi:thioredoxin 1
VISPIFTELSEKPEYQGIKFVKVDTEDQAEIAQELGITALPTFVLFQNGKKVAQVLGANRASLEV